MANYRGFQMLNSNLISRQIEEYITYMNSIGIKLENTATSLRMFAKFTRERGYTNSLTWQIVKEYCERDGEESSLKTKERRFEFISPFGKYVRNIYPNTEVLPIQPYGRRAKRPRPHIYTTQEITELLKRCNTIYSPDGIRALTLETAICLMLTTGIRTQELVMLRVSDFDISRKLLFVRKGKNERQRILPLSDSTAKKLLEYRNSVEAMISYQFSKEDFFFLNTGGKPMKKANLEYAFSKIRDCVDVSDSDYKVPILYHLRHTFACRTIQNWIKNGCDINSKLYILSTYLGHVHPQETYWYLSATDALLRSASIQYEEFLGGDDRNE